MTLRDGDPRTVGGYRLEGRLGAGGMGVVYRARSLSGRQVAVKVVRPELAGDPAFRQRFRREVAAVRQVSGAFTASVVDADPDAEAPWLATVFVPGPTLAERVQEQGPLPVAEVWLLAAGLVEALRDIHRVGLVHRDLKPGNVLLAQDGPRVIDFGIARAVDGSEVTALTGTGVVVGTPPFMAPEQFLRGEVGPATDVFALGSVLVHAATGHGPFGGDHAHAVGFRVVYEAPDLTGLPPELLPLVESCLAKAPAERPTVPGLLAALAAGPITAGVAGAPAPAPVDPGPPDGTGSPASAVGVAPAGGLGPPPTLTEDPAPAVGADAPPVSGEPEPAQDAGAADRERAARKHRTWLRWQVEEPRRRRWTRGGVAAAVAVALGVGAVPLTQWLLDADRTGGGSSSSSQGPPQPGASAFACGPDGSITVAGATSLKAALDRWQADYQAACPGARQFYALSGSGSAIQQFTAGSADFAVVDRLLTPAQVDSAAGRCPGGKPVHLPLGAMPVAVVVNLPGIDWLALNPTTLARIFRGQVTRWNHAEITATNPGRTLPDTAIQVVAPADESTTTLIFTQYLTKAAPTAWGTTTPQPSLTRVGSGPGATSSTVARTVRQTVGAIGFTRLGGEATGMSTVRLATGAPEPVAVSADSATKAVDTGGRLTGTGADLAVELDPTSKAAGAYPIVQLGYAVVCDRGNNAAALARSRSFIAAAVSEPEQHAVAEDGYGPLPPALAQKVRETLATLG
ncbi:substrate-binding domain-containing protein [Streptomyces sp. NPDC059708]|uniref:protein kinase domain-containing protein n=1 Tax=Streptomyces sp. NPDC059708 TaxID=3346916 RepID=UPI00369ED8D5